MQNREHTIQNLKSPTPSPPFAAPLRQLTLFDSTCIIVGIIVGAAIYESSPRIAASVPGPVWLIAFWLLGGVMSLIGSLCYAELATAYPREGGDYVFLTRALGRACGFLFAWVQLWIVRPGSIGAMGFVFANYANQIWPLHGASAAPVEYAAMAILLLTVVNIVGVRAGKWTQNLLTVAKVIGLGSIFVAAILFAPPAVHVPAPAAGAAHWNIGMAMIFIFFAYGGWNEMAYVGAEVRDPNRNIVRALVLGTVAVTVIYVLVNLAFLKTLGFEGTCRSDAVAAEVMRLVGGRWGSRFISALVCVSALGAINGQIFTGARIYYAMGTEHRLYSRLGRWNARLGTPVWSLAIQAVITMGLVIVFGMMQNGSQNGFDRLVIFTTPAFWIFLFLVGVSLFVLRFREPNTPRPFRVPGYPITPLLFCGSSLFMVWSSLQWAWINRSPEAFWSIVILAIGLVLSFFTPRDSK